MAARFNIAFGALALAATGCYAPGSSNESLTESIVVTSRNETTDFGSFHTFFLRPEVRVLEEKDGILPGPDDEPELLPDVAAAPLLAETKKNLIARGYQEVDVKDDADLAVELVYARAIFSDYYCYYWYDWGYWGYPGWGYYYPYSCSTVAWTSGMLITNAFDLKSAVEPPPNAPNVLRGAWFSSVYGVEVDSKDYLVDRAVDGISQAFAQSPYFKAGTP
jgi:hypothetical protein